LEVLALRYKQIYKISCGKTSNKRQYEIVIGELFSLHLHGFCDYDFELIGKMKEMGAM
jgi:hypothetical protein